MPPDGCEADGKAKTAPEKNAAIPANYRMSRRVGKNFGIAQVGENSAITQAGSPPTGTAAACRQPDAKQTGKRKAADGTCLHDFRQ